MRERVDALSRELEARGGADAPASALPDGLHRRLAKLGSGAVALGLLAWKLKFAVVFLATKGKLLLLGLTKATTLFSMLLSFGVYWSVWGWKFGAGLVAALYVHEMGHVAALRSLGIAAGAPTFIPGIGAAVRMKQYPASPREDARVGLAGPIWGLAASGAALAGWWLSGWAALGAIARVSAWINLFNLLPVWQLDGSRGFRALATSGRWICSVAMLALWAFTEESLFALLAGVAALRALAPGAPAASDRRTLVEFLLLLGALGLVCTAQAGPV